MAFDYKRALVTGGAGFIGSHLTEALVAEGCRVVVLDNLTSGHLANLDAVIDQIDFIQGDIRDPQTVSKAIKDSEVVFHLAAVVSVPQTVEQPVESAMVNDMGTLNIFEAARDNRVGSVVFASSSAVYGDDPELPKHEALKPKPLSPYAVQKITGEYYAHMYNDLYGVKSTALRFFNVYGPRQDPSSPYSGVISIFMQKAVTGSQPTIFGDGTQSRDFIYVKDVVRANMLAAAAPAAGGTSINVGTGKSVSINRLWEIISQTNGSKEQPQYAPPRSGDIHASVADISLAKSLIGFSPEYTFDKGLGQTFKWYRKSSTYSGA